MTILSRTPSYWYRETCRTCTYAQQRNYFFITLLVSAFHVCQYATRTHKITQVSTKSVFQTQLWMALTSGQPLVVGRPLPGMSLSTILMKSPKMLLSGTDFYS